MIISNYETKISQHFSTLESCKWLTGVFGSKVASHSSKKLEDCAGTRTLFGEGRLTAVCSTHTGDNISIEKNYY